ncbi:MAG: glycosyltransferase family 39 protein [Myxococcales bacterium]|nr:MAG: glycosyltransferase family 39 protein [Myxococcales bacterium]
MLQLSSSKTNHAVAALLASLYLCLLWNTADDLAMCRDESFYVFASESYGNWFELLATNPHQAFEQSTIDHHWAYNHEHPSLMKSLAALTWLTQKHFHLFPSDSLAFRFPTMLLSSLLLWLVFIWSTSLYGRAAGLFSALGMALIPRFFYHAHLHAFDAPIVFLVTWVAYCYWRSLSDRKWIWLTVLSFGLCLDTKHNSWVLPGIFLIHWLAQRGKERLFKFDNQSSLPWALGGMLLLSPWIAIALWPWLWHDTWHRIGSYIFFHTHHAESHGVINIAYFGKTLFSPPFPIALPFILTAYTLPLTFLVPSVLGSLKAAFAWFKPDADKCELCRSELLMLGMQWAPLIVIALPSSPVFGGTKHWLTAYPFFAMFFAKTLSHCLGVGKELLAPYLKGNALMQRVMTALALCLFLTPSAYETKHAHPFALSHYGVLAGGVQGAASKGMNRQFWGFTTGSVVSYLKEKLPNGGTVWIGDTTFGAWEMLIRDGKVPANIRATQDFTRADYLLIHHEQHFAEVEYQAWVLNQSVKPDHLLLYDGVPIISIYKNQKRLSQKNKQP